MLNAITPALQTEVANINFELEVKAEEILAGLSLTSRRSVVKHIREVLAILRPTAKPCVEYGHTQAALLREQVMVPIESEGPNVPR